MPTEAENIGIGWIEKPRSRKRKGRGRKGRKSTGPKVSDTERGQAPFHARVE